MSYRDPEIVKKMTRLVAEGAVMLAEMCPLDGLPLFKLKSGEVVCPSHGKVHIVKSEEEAVEVEVEYLLRDILRAAVRRAKEAVEEEDAEEALRWLSVAEAAGRIRARQEKGEEKAREGTKQS
ncbi:MAG: hypothetical protein NZ902_00540 [Acidilobaceae archaeon]|nr:hypothetical protein [Acidilobaceae archaeon]MCX8165321.1 hypothetical protein [Acidilobaceae archaeon]MDW7973747.1 Sjogren's syndrome/scleroderma autoantigen 1 family protein [Sulfolobales archaeon]